MSEKAFIREARMEDAGDLARLSAQLGYPCRDREVETRLARREGRDDGTVLVVEEEGRVLAWASLEVVDRFYIETFAELTGLVVDEARRRQGLGELLIEAAERWTRARGLDTLRLKTNVVRREAHLFYERLGFEKVKEQFTYLKQLVPARE